MGRHGNLIRKQYLVSEDNIQKVEKIAGSQGTSAADVVRKAIDAYDPHGAGELEAPDLMDLVSEKLKQAISSTKSANQKVAKALKSLDSVKV